MKKAIIEITTVQCVDGEQEENSVSYRGRCQMQENAVILQYMEKSENGTMRTRIHLQENACDIESIGDISRHMEFAVGRQTECKLLLPMGEIRMGITTHRYALTKRNGESGGFKVRLSYDLTDGNGIVVSNVLHMNIDIEKP